MDYLDVTFSLYNGLVYPFRKNDQYPCYIDVGFNHPKKVFKQISNSVVLSPWLTMQTHNTYTYAYRIITTQ